MYGETRLLAASDKPQTSAAPSGGPLHHWPRSSSPAGRRTLRGAARPTAPDTPGTGPAPPSRHRRQEAPRAFPRSPAPRPGRAGRPGGRGARRGRSGGRGRRRRAIVPQPSRARRRTGPGGSGAAAAQSGNRCALPPPPGPPPRRPPQRGQVLGAGRPAAPPCDRLQPSDRRATAAARAANGARSPLRLPPLSQPGDVWGRSARPYPAATAWEQSPRRLRPRLRPQRGLRPCEAALTPRPPRPRGAQPLTAGRGATAVARARAGGKIPGSRRGNSPFRKPFLCAPKQVAPT